MKKNNKNNNSYKDDDIAVIGIGFKIAGAENLDDYWGIFENNIDCIRDLPDYRKEDIKDFAHLYSQILQKEKESISYNKAGYLDRIDEFDNEFFKISPIEAQVMDPVQRILLETVYSAFDDAGYTSEKLKGTKTGIYIGYTPGSMKDNYSTNIFYNNPELIKYSHVGNMPCILPSRASYALNLHGPTMVIDSACSSSLVAIHDACVSIKNGTCSMAIAGGIRLHSFPIAFEDMNVGFETDDNKTRTFDNFASGAAIGEGSAVVLLKSLKEAEKDQDNIYAVIKGAAVNNDGTSASITAPNPAAQKQVLLDAFKSADISPDMIDYIETHGTATALGDPIEFRGLTTAFEKHTDRKQFCALSSSKSNIGHLYEAAGVASFIKAIAALKNKKIPGSSHFNIPNLKIDFCDSPFYINSQTQDWKKDGLRLCGISAFGISGTNCHVVLQEYENQQKYFELTGNNIIGISAKSLESLVVLFKKYKGFLEENTVDVSLFASNANLYRTHYAKRLGIVFSDKNNLIDVLNKLANSTPEEWSNISGVYYINEGSKSEEINYNQFRSALQRSNTNFLSNIEGNNNETNNNELNFDLDYLARMYSSGARFDWSLLYKGFEPNRISIPYYPFKRTRFWLPKKEQKRSLNILQSPSDNNGNVDPTIYSDLYYKRIFVEADPIERNNKLERCLLIQQNNVQADGLHNELKQKFFDVERIQIDNNEANRIGIEKYFSQLYRNINFKDISHVVIAGLQERKDKWAVEELLDTHKIQLLSVICLYREFLTYDNNIKVTPLMNSCFQITGDEEYLDPNSSPVFGLCKSLNRMFKNISSCCIDIDNRTGWNKIVDEICALSKKDIIAYRNDRRYFEGLSDTHIETEDNQLVIKDNGVYFISGGLGGIGFETAMEMVNRAKNVSLILVGRSILPEESKWDTILRNNKESEVIEKVERISLLKNKTNNVEYYALDIGDKEALKSVIQDVNRKYGKINGVIHAAGVSGSINFDNLNEEHITKMIMPKVIGTYVLDHLTRDQNLDFFLMFSSISTIFSSADLPGYVAGNMYLDSYSDYRKMASGSKSITVNWATWSETGMAVKDNFTIDTLFQTIKTREAINAVFNVLINDSGSVVIARLNLKDKISMLLKTYPMQLSSRIVRAMEEEKNENNNNNNQQSLPFKNSTQYENIEETLIKVCCKNLGYEDINIHHNFFELGANSILLAIIFKDLNEMFPGLLQVTDLFSYPSVSLLAEHISNTIDQIDVRVEHFDKEIDTINNPNIESRPNIEIVEGAIQVNRNTITASSIETKSVNNNDDDDSIAIIGVGLDLPSAKNLDSYWEMLINGINAVREIPDDRAFDITKHLLWKNYSEDQIRFRRSGYLDEINKFDHAFFGISPRDAALLDPVMRIFLECCSNAIDDSGYGADGVKGTNTGVFLGYTANLGNAYNKLLYEMDPKLFSAALPIGQVSMTASRTAYMFDLKGPSMVIDTACSSSLVALHMACEQIRFGKCDMALAGGASLMGIPLDDGSGIGFESPEEKTRAFSDNSSGAAIGEGVGVVLLKSLKQAQRDGDSIYAVIKGSSINQDGSSFGIAAPNYLAQSEAIQKAWTDAGVTANDISYIEAHGTGTQLGDPIEVKGITNAFETVTNDKQVCGLGSVKTNVGHANEAAGMCGLFKCILTLQNKLIPPTLNFQAPNNNIDFINSPLYIVDKMTPLKAKGEKAIVGISGFGMSGTNAHIILEEAPKANNVNKNSDKGPMIFTMSAKTEKAVFQLVESYKLLLHKNNDIDLYDLTSTLNMGRRHYSQRVAFLFHDQNELLNKLDELSKYGSFDMIKNDWCFFGNYAVVPEIKKEKYPYEITLKEQQKLNETAKVYCLKTGKRNTLELEEILKLYIKGAEVEWKYLYNQPYSKLHLPTYPYARNHHWYKIPTKEKSIVNEITNETVPDSFFHHKKWVLQNNLNINFSRKDETYIITHSDSKGKNLLSKELREKGVRVIDVFISDKRFKKIDDDTYYIENSVDDFKELFSNLSNIKISKIVHLGAYRDFEVSNANELYAEFEYGFFNVVNLVKGLMKARIDQKINLILVACNAYGISGMEKNLLPHNATVLSLGKVIEQEYQNIRCSAIDADMDTPVNNIINQLFADDNKMYLVGLRQGKSYIEEFDEVEVKPETENRIVNGGTYIITGGTSGIGLQNAKLFSMQAKCNLILLSRKGFPEESAWREYREMEDYSVRIKDFEEIKRNGSKLEIVKCDISNENDVQKVLEFVRKKYEKINGIVHCAGVIEPGFILRKEKEKFLSVFAPKIMGTWILGKLTQNDNLDFILLHSSNVTDAGEPGQSCYTSANAFLDSYTDYLNHQGRNTYTVNWVAWKETGMAFKHGTNVDTTTKAITTNEALNALNQLLRSKPQRVVIGQFNENINILTLIKQSRNYVAQNFINKALILSNKRTMGEVAAVTEMVPLPVIQEINNDNVSTGEVKLTGNIEGVYTAVEKQIGKTYCDILEYEEADIYEGFFEMGGDSILITDMHDIIDQMYPNIVQIADLFEFDSIHSLSEFITSQIKKVERVKHENLKEIKLVGNVEGIYTPIEKQIGTIYCEILEYDEVDIYEGFFEMGGDSILITDMHDIIDQMYPNIVQIADLFEFDSIHSLSEFITSQNKKVEKESLNDESNKNNQVKVQMVNNYYDMSCSQERIYYDYRLNNNKFVYNIGFISDETDNEYEDLVVNANKFFSEFDMFRTTFKIVNKKLVQFVNPIKPIKIKHVKIESAENIDFKKYLKTFKLSEYPLFNLTLFEAPNKKMLLFDVHHILLDGYSSTILQEHMQAFGKGIKLEKPLYPYSKYVEFEKTFYNSVEYKSMGEYWRTELKGFDFTNPLKTKDSDDISYGNITVELNSELSDELLGFSKGRKTTLFNILLSAFNIALNKFTGRNDITVLTPVLNRYKPEFKNSIGVFTNLIPIRVNMDSNLILEEFLKNVTQKTVCGIKSQFYQYNHIISDLKSSDSDPQFFFYMDFEDKSLKKNRITEDIPHAVNIPKFMLDLEIKNLNNHYNISASYKKSHFREDEVAYILDLIIRILKEVFTNDNSKKTLDHLIKQLD